MNRILDWLREVGRWIRPFSLPFPPRPVFAPVRVPHDETQGQGPGRRQ